MLLDLETVYAELLAQDFPKLPVLRRANIYGERYYYRLKRGTAEGQDSVVFYNSVTSVTHKTVGDKGQLIKWAADKGDSYKQEMLQSAAYGTLVHCFLPRLVDDKGQGYEVLTNAYDHFSERMKLAAERTYLQQNKQLLMGKLRKDLYAIHCCLKDLSFEPLAVELCLSSDVLGVAGALDLVGYITTDRKQLALLDLKTGCRDGNFYPDYEAQLAIYAKLWNDNPELVRCYGRVETIANFSPKDFTVASRTFYNLKVWDYEKAEAEAESYLSIYERNHAADLGGAAIAQKKLQLFSGTVGYGQQPERNVQTYQQYLTEQHKADFKTLPFAEEPKPIGVVTAVTENGEGLTVSVQASADFLQAAAQYGEAGEIQSAPAAQQGANQGITAALLDTYRLELPVIQKGRPPAEYSAVKDHNTMLGRCSTYQQLWDLYLKLPTETKVQKLTKALLDTTLQKIAADSRQPDPDPNPDPSVDKELDKQAAAVEATAAFTEAGRTLREIDSYENSPNANEKVAAPLVAIQPAQEQPLPEAVVTDLQDIAKMPAETGQDMARKRLALANQKLHELTKKSMAGIIDAEEYEQERNRLAVIRGAYIAALEEYKAQEYKVAKIPF